MDTLFLPLDSLEHHAYSTSEDSEAVMFTIVFSTSWIEKYSSVLFIADLDTTVQGELTQAML